MKKYTYILLICLLNFTACGKKQTVNNNLSLPPTQNTMTEQNNPEPVINDSNTNNANTNTGVEETVPKPEILSAQMFEPIVQVGDTILTLPIVYSDILAAGAVCMDAQYSESYLVDANAYHIVSFRIRDTQTKLYVYNDTDDKIQMKDAIIKNIHSTNGDDIIFPGGICTGIDLNELTTIWGNDFEDASQSSSDTLTYVYRQYPYVSNRLVGHYGSDVRSATGNTYSVRIDRNTAKITEFSHSFTDGVGSDAVYEGKFEFNNGNKLHYSLPGNFYYNGISGVGQSVLIIDGKEYIAVLDIPGTSWQWDIKEGESLTEGLDGHFNKTDAYSHSSRNAYNVRVVSNDDKAYAAGYLLEDGKYSAIGGFAQGKKIFTSTTTYMIPLNPNDEITPNAQKAFEKLFEDLVLSMHFEE